MIIKLFAIILVLFCVLFVGMLFGSQLEHERIKKDYKLTRINL